MTHEDFAQAGEERAIRQLYEEILKRWNERRAADYAALFAEDANGVGFDGSQVNGRSEIAAHLSHIFADHQTAAYIGIVREVRLLAPEVAVLRAVVGMTPPGQSDINPAANAIQTLVATRRQGAWLTAVFHNTPAAFHGRPEAAEQLTAELRGALTSPRDGTAGSARPAGA